MCSARMDKNKREGGRIDYTHTQPPKKQKRVESGTGSRPTHHGDDMCIDAMGTSKQYDRTKARVSRWPTRACLLVIRYRNDRRFRQRTRSRRRLFRFRKRAHGGFHAVAFEIRGQQPVVGTAVFACV
jgi:hypothetical protein